MPPDGDNSGDELIKALTNTVLTIDAIYQWLDQVEKLGGATNMEGVARCHAMLTSLKKNRKRVEELVLKPAREMIARSLREPELAAPVGSAGSPRPATKNRPPRGQRPETRRSSDEVKR